MDWFFLLVAIPVGVLVFPVTAAVVCVAWKTHKDMTDGWADYERRIREDQGPPKKIDGEGHKRHRRW